MISKERLDKINKWLDKIKDEKPTLRRELILEKVINELMLGIHELLIKFGLEDEQ